jgi:hypothetical protein
MPSERKGRFAGVGAVLAMKVGRISEGARECEGDTRFY